MAKTSTSDASPFAGGARPGEPATRAFRIGLAGIVLLGLALCLWMNRDRAWQGDEWGSLLALREGYVHLLRHFGDWQTMNFYLAGLKFIAQLTGDRHWALVLPGIIAGCWLIVLTADIARRLADRRTALIAALLVATSPFLVTYCVTVRSYIFLAAFSSAMLKSYLDWRRSGSWRDGVLVAAFAALALIAHLNAVYAIGAVAVLASASITRPRALVRLTAPVVLGLGLAAALYLPQMTDIAAFRLKYASTPPTGLFFLPTVFGLFFDTGWYALPAVAAAIYAAWRVVRDRRPSQLLLAAVGIPVAAICLAGLSHGADSYARFLIFVLPWLLILIADGLMATRGPGARLAAGAILILLLVTQAHGLAARHQAFGDFPWHRVSAFVRARQHPGDACIQMGRSAHSAAMRTYGVAATQGVAPAIARLAPGTSQLFVIDPDGVLPEAGITGRFGVIQVVVFAGTTSEIARQVNEMFTQAAEGSTGPWRARLYEELAHLASWQGDAERARRYRLLRYP